MPARWLCGFCGIKSNCEEQVAGEKVRLFGLDAPEKAQLCQDSSDHEYKCGEWFALALP
jgi:hypothetical protein